MQHVHCIVKIRTHLLLSSGGTLDSNSILQVCLLQYLNPSQFLKVIYSQCCNLRLRWLELVLNLKLKSSKMDKNSGHSWSWGTTRCSVNVSASTLAVAQCGSWPGSDRYYPLLRELRSLCVCVCELVFLLTVSSATDSVFPYWLSRSMCLC